MRIKPLPIEASRLKIVGQGFKAQSVWARRR